MEVELKFLKIDKAAMIKQIEALGAVQQYDARVEDVFFENAHISWKKPGASLVRLRKIGDKVFLTCKGAKLPGTMKVREETEAAVGEFDAMKKLLEQLGFTASQPFVKRRIHYTLGTTCFEIEHVGEHPPYLEIETQSEDAMKDICAQLDLKMSDGDTRSWMEIYGVS